MGAMKTSTDPIVHELFGDVEPVIGSLPKGQLISCQYIVQLKMMMDIINSTECHFIRCVKTNEEKKPLTFNNAKILIQLYALSIFEALQLRTLGYSYRRGFEEFLYQFRFINMEAYRGQGDPAQRCVDLLASAGLKQDKETVAVGKTMVFLKKDKLNYLGKRVREALKVWEPVIGCIEAMYLTHIKMKVFKTYAPQINRLQAHARRILEINK